MEASTSGALSTPVADLVALASTEIVPASGILVRQQDGIPGNLSAFTPSFQSAGNSLSKHNKIAGSGQPCRAIQGMTFRSK
jgi:hypothetical protein